MKQFNSFVLGLVLLFTACSPATQEQQEQGGEIIEQKDMMGNAGRISIPMGFWKAELAMQEQTLPFRFEVMQKKGGDPIIYLLNADEKLLLDEFEQVGDSIKIDLHIFNAEIIAKVGDAEMTGRWIRKDYEDYQVPFKAYFVDDFTVEAEPKGNVAGRWAVTFKGTAEGEADEEAVGIFEQEESGKVTGTFLTTTGDYRYLEGKLDGDKLLLSCFDGAHSFLFKATLNDKKELVEGHFWNGKHWHQEWEAKKDPNADLPDPSSLTFLKDGYDKLAFEFPNLEGNTVSLTDEKYKGKVVVVQIFGSWCPNCMDETKFLSPYYNDNKDRGVEVIALAFERSPKFEEASARVKKMRDKLGVNYEILIAGVNDKKEAAKKLPMLNHILSYPTTIFIDKEGIVRKIHTGFTGPGTGEYYVQFVEEFKQFVDKLVAENPS